MRRRNDFRTRRSNRPDRPDYATQGAVRANHWAMSLDSTPNDRKFICVVEDFQKLWPELLGGMMSEVIFDSYGCSDDYDILSSPGATIVKANEGSIFAGKSFVDAIVKSWNNRMSSVNYVTSTPSFICTINGRQVALAPKDRLLAIVDLDKARIGSEGRILEERKFRTDPRDTETMLIRLNPGKVLANIGIQEDHYPAIARCAKRITAVQKLLRALSIPAIFINPRNHDDYKHLFGCLKWNEESSDIEINCEELFNKIVSKTSKVENRNELQQQNNREEFMKRLRATDLPDDIQGHLVSCLLLFMHLEMNDRTLSNESQVRNFHKRKLPRALGQNASLFPQSDMGLDIEKWFLQRDISDN